MKRSIPVLLSIALVSSTVACSKAPEQANTAAGANKSTSTALAKPVAIPAGTTLNTDLQQALSSGKNRAQDQFTLKVKSGWFDKNPELKGAQIEGHLEQVVKAEKGKKARLELVFDGVKLKNGDLYPLDATLVNTQIESKTKGKFLQNTGIILGGVVAGRFLGDKAKFKHGGLAGGAAAAAFVLSSPGGEVALQKGTDVQLKLKSPLKFD